MEMYWEAELQLHAFLKSLLCNKAVSCLPWAFYTRENNPCVYVRVGWDSSVGTATGYGLDGPVIETHWGQDFPHLSKTALGPTQPLVQQVPGLSPGVKSGRGVTLTPHPLLVPLVMKEQSYNSTPRMGRTACTEPQCLYKGDLYLYLFFNIRPFAGTVEKGRDSYLCGESNSDPSVVRPVSQSL